MIKSLCVAGALLISVAAEAQDMRVLVYAPAK